MSDCGRTTDVANHWELEECRMSAMPGESGHSDDVADVAWRAAGQNTEEEEAGGDGDDEEEVRSHQAGCEGKPLKTTIACSV